MTELKDTKNDQKEVNNYQNEMKMIPVRHKMTKRDEIVPKRQKM